ncbi:MAG TPA: HAD family hydrolase [Anaerolineales bacterium]
MIKAIFFDLDGTIRSNEPRGTDVFADYAALLGQRIRDDDRLRAMRWEHYYWALSQELDEDYKTYGRLTDDFWRRYAHRQLVALGASKAQATALAPKMHAYMTESYRPASVVPAELPGVLQSLKDAGHTLGVISNREHPFADELDELGLTPFFALTIASGEFNTWKPEPQIFLHACAQLGLQPNETVYVGDNWFADVVGAKNAGVTPVLYDPRGIFDDPECDVIRSFTELPRTLRLNGRA